MKTPAYVTQRQVAGRAGVHQTTVSLVFRNHPSVPASTRERVLEIARELGYRRHPLLSALMSTRLRVSQVEQGTTLAFLTDFEERDAWKKSATALAMFEGAGERARSLGYRLEAFWLGSPKTRPARLAQILRTRGIPGVLLAPTATPRGVLEFDFSGFASVGLGVGGPGPGLLSVTHDHFGGMSLALNRARAAGRRRVAVLLSVSVNERVREKWLAAHAFARDAGRAPKSIPVWTADRNLEPAGLGAWLDRHRPDALVGTFDGRVRPMLKTLGRRVPDDLALVSLSASPGEPFFAGVHQRSELLGARAIDLLVGALHRNEQGRLDMRQILEIEGEWQPGPSLPEAV